MVLSSPLPSPPPAPATLLSHIQRVSGGASLWHKMTPNALICIPYNEVEAFLPPYIQIHSWD